MLNLVAHRLQALPAGRRFCAAASSRAGRAQRMAPVRAGHHEQHSGLSAVIVDYDGTCTKEDTIGTLMSAAVAAQCTASPSKDPQQLIATVSQLAANYSSQYKQLLQKILPSQASASYDPAGLSHFLEQLSDFDVAMNDIVAESGTLAGLTESQLAEAAQSVELQPGCQQALQRASAMRIPVHVLSVNWSAGFVASGMRRLALKPCSKESMDRLAQEGTLPGNDADEVQGQSLPGLIFANELSTDPSGMSNGGIDRGVQCARDKAAIIHGLRSHYAQRAGKAGGSIVYVGDSVSDLQALLAAHYGILIGHNQLARQVLSTFGVSLVPLGTSIQQYQGPVLYEAANWAEIEEFLAQKASLGTQPSLHRAPRVLSIAGSDSGGGAGVQADLKAVMACGGFGMCAVTALTAQNTQGVHSVHVTPVSFLGEQIDAVLADIGADAVKTGMLPNPEVVELVASKLKQHRVAHLVVDPVLVSTSGHSLAEDSVAMALLRHLTPLATLITPNIPEASALLGGTPIHTIADMEHAARALQSAAQCQAVLIKGGHLAFGQEPAPEPSSDPSSSSSSRLGSHSMPGGKARVDQKGDPSTTSPAQTGASLPAAGADAQGSILNSSGSIHNSSEGPPCSSGRGGQGLMTDVLFDGKRTHRLVRERVSTRNTHGTGCTLASAIAAELSKGLPLIEAVEAASQYLNAALWHSRHTLIGTGAQRPFNHGWMLSDWERSRFPVYTVEGMQHQRADRAFVERALRLYAVTDPDMNKRNGRSLHDAVSAAIAGGATMVQIREKDTDGRGFLAGVKSVLPVCRAAGVPLIVNDRVDVALAAGPDVGVHIGQEDLPAKEVRRMLGPHRIMGVSVKTVQEALRAKEDGADYLGAGAVYASTTKQSGVIGLPGLQEVCRAASPVPVVAIGGIQPHNAVAPLEAGAFGIAVVSVLFNAPDVREATTKLREQLRPVFQQDS